MKLISLTPKALPAELSRPWVTEDFSKLSEFEGFAIIDFHPELTFILLEPILRFVASGAQSTAIDKEGKTYSSAGTFELLSEIGDFGSKETSGGSIPIVAGFLSYELLHQIENVSENINDPYQMEDFSFYCYQKIVALPKNSQAPTLCYELAYSKEFEPFWEWDGSRPDPGSEILINTSPSEFVESIFSDPPSNFTKKSYCAAVAEIVEQIARGEVYQVNLSQRFELPFNSDSFNLYRASSQICRPRYGAFLKSGNQQAENARTIISASPELFLRSDGRSLLSSPIKGTRPRSKDPTIDRALALELLESEKDRAELAMIVDLIRNDMGKVAKVGTVQVTEHARLESHPQVHHLVSDITCELEQHALFGEIIRALFPCGSVTGAPKIAAMKQIASLERANRGVYTGAIGYFNSRGGFEFNVAIRTGVVCNKKFIFQAGGGVVYDSEPVAEYEETLAKAKGLLLAYEGSRVGQS